MIKLSLVFLLFSFNAFAQVNNMNNSSYNMQNSPYNMKNIPYNMDNSQYNTNSTNGVYDNSGNRTGYKVEAPSGVTNYYDNKGNRTGYTPSQR